MQLLHLVAVVEQRLVHGFAVLREVLDVRAVALELRVDVVDPGAGGSCK